MIKHEKDSSEYTISLQTPKGEFGAMHSQYVTRSISNYARSAMAVMYICHSVVGALRVRSEAGGRGKRRLRCIIRVYTMSRVRRYADNPAIVPGRPGRCAITVRRILIESARRVPRAIRHRDSGYPARASTFDNRGGACSLFGHLCPVGMILGCRVGAPSIPLNRFRRTSARPRPCGRPFRKTVRPKDVPRFRRVTEVAEADDDRLALRTENPRRTLALPNSGDQVLCVILSSRIADFQDSARFPEQLWVPVRSVTGHLSEIFRKIEKMFLLLKDALGSCRKFPEIIYLVELDFLNNHEFLLKEFQTCDSQWENSGLNFQITFFNIL